MRELGDDEEEDTKKLSKRSQGTMGRVEVGAAVGTFVALVGMLGLVALIATKSLRADSAESAKLLEATLITEESGDFRLYTYSTSSSEPLGVTTPEGGKSMEEMEREINAKMKREYACRLPYLVLNDDDVSC